MSKKLIQFIQSMCIIFTASMITMICSYIATGQTETIAIRDVYIMLAFSIATTFIQQLLFTHSIKTKRSFYSRLIVFFLFISAAILGLGWLFDWYDTIAGFMIILGFICVTFMVMHAFFSYRDVKFSNEINQKLAEMRERETK
ncbi:DUF3021 family protein [Listeria cossartiae]|uniref:DUF3021 family protein n=1 Tax=Listeria cossartiae TaxID=2838249 RepID=UPI001625BF26|nr:DUF3021 family protein [Listeria cossartiae]MBC1543483.1 DUF3021 family protein [Listeria cossartiae subsp. cossartiae]MBC1549057.1 DUF3021 family protein [Listeria cossartiae subsp. cossartiae]MBC1567526.1 DUF3021 family protein [Listeria cossartiae subsp. cossartiae]MBC1570682.1 DUF3021 family protein [Listeria cossartiae subsp. cossartiae]MBC1986376.1 DUF3021 family protein [Listeria cossartiae subsp. cossartiae]